MSVLDFLVSNKRRQYIKEAVEDLKKEYDIPPVTNSKLVSIAKDNGIYLKCDRDFPASHLYVDKNDRYVALLPYRKIESELPEMIAECLLGDYSMFEIGMFKRELLEKSTWENIKNYIRTHKESEEAWFQDYLLCSDGMDEAIKEIKELDLYEEQIEEVLSEIKRIRKLPDFILRRKR